MNRIEVKTQIQEGEIEIFEFILFDLTAVFVEYKKQFKPKGKRVWKIEVLWNKYQTRDNKISEPILTEAIRTEAMAEIVKLIQVKTWNEFKPEK